MEVGRWSGERKVTTGVREVGTLTQQQPHEVAEGHMDKASLKAELRNGRENKEHWDL